MLKIAEDWEDIMFLFTTRTDPEIDKYLTGHAPTDYKQHLQFIDKTQKKSRYIYIFHVGYKRAGYSQMYDFQDDTVEIGFVVSTEHQGKGHGQKLVEETIQKAKDHFPHKKIILYVLESNPRGIHIYTKLGFKETDRQDGSIRMELA